MSTAKLATVTYLGLGAIWARDGMYVGPSLATGADGGRVDVLKLTRTDRTAIVALANERCFLATARQLRQALSAAGWTIAEHRTHADDVASCQLVLPQVGRECASTGLIFSEGGFCGAWIDTAHTLEHDLTAAGIAQIR